MATHFRTFAWKIPWTAEPGRPQSMGSQSRTRLSDFASLHFSNKRKELSDICKSPFIAALFIIAKRWKQLKCLSTDEYVNKI